MKIIKLTAQKIYNRGRPDSFSITFSIKKTDGKRGEQETSPEPLLRKALEQLKKIFVTKVEKGSISITTDDKKRNVVSINYEIFNSPEQFIDIISKILFTLEDGKIKEELIAILICAYFEKISDDYKKQVADQPEEAIEDILDDFLSENNLLSVLSTLLRDIRMLNIELQELVKPLNDNIYLKAFVLDFYVNFITSEACEIINYDIRIEKLLVIARHMPLALVDKWRFDGPDEQDLPIDETRINDFLTMLFGSIAPNAGDESSQQINYVTTLLEFRDNLLNNIADTDPEESREELKRILEDSGFGIQDITTHIKPLLGLNMSAELTADMTFNFVPEYGTEPTSEIAWGELSAMLLEQKDDDFAKGLKILHKVHAHQQELPQEGKYAAKFGRTVTFRKSTDKSFPLSSTQEHRPKSAAEQACNVM